MKECKGTLHTGERLLPLSAFPKDKSTRDGHHSQCKACARKRKQNWLQRVYDGDPTVQSLNDLRKDHNERGKNYKRKRGFTYTLLTSCRRRANKKGLDFDLTENDIIIPKVCPILNIPLLQEWKPDRHHIKEAGYPSVDRIDSSKGYTKDNIQIISWRANSLKNNATLQEMVLLGEFAKKLLS